MFTTQQVLCLVIILLAVLVGVLLYLRFFRPDAAPRPFAQLIQGGDDLNAYRQEVAHLRQQLARLQDEMTQLRQNQAGKMAPLQGGANYSQAIEMARQGLSISEVANQCGISRAEAELIVAMHGGKKET